MNDELFSELISSVREAGDILRGHQDPSRRFDFEDPDVAAIRDEFGLSQSKFAALLGISVRTLQNWEQGRRPTSGPGPGSSTS
jgi:putative transcriptional regulator